MQRRFQNFSYKQLQCTLIVTFDDSYFILLKIETNEPSQQKCVPLRVVQSLEEINNIILL